MPTKTVLALLLVLGLFGAAGCGSGSSADSVELLNASYDPTRELWRALNEVFEPQYEAQTGKRLKIKQSHGGSGSQARAVIDGLDADVVTLALWSDTNDVHRRGLIDAGWDRRLPNDSLPYLSTIVFVVRAGNPKGIKDWPDLVRPGVEIVTPNPKTSGNGKLAFLAAWGSVLHRKGTEDQAREFVTQLYQQAPALDLGARAATMRFGKRRIGDVHLTWENEAHLEMKEFPGQLQIVYPPASIRAEPHVAVVDANVRRKGTQDAAEKYLRFLYTPEAQEIIARHYYRPIQPDVLQKHAATFPAIDLFPITTVARDWDDAQQRFFADGGEFDTIYQRK